MKKFEYGKPNAGWFPIESASFGFQAQSESTAGAGQSENGQSQRGGAANQSSSRPAAPQPGGGAATADSESESKISISKFVDSATVTLMGLAMADRKKTKTQKAKSQSEKPFKADIHFLESVHNKGDKKSRFVFPYMMIHLEDVLIKSWNISAQGDDRPAETLELWFDKLALKYFKTTDGIIWNRAGCQGWDQQANESWTPPEKGYFEDPKTY